MMSSHEYLNNKVLEGVIVKFQKCKRDKARYETLIEVLREHPDRKLQSPLREADVDLAECLTEYAALAVEYDETQSQLAASFYLLSENIIRYGKTKWGPTAFNLTDEDDAIQEGVMICFEKLDRFNPDRGKAFNYFTTISINALRQMYRSARNYSELKRRYHDHIIQIIQNDANSRYLREKLSKISQKPAGES